MHKIKLIFFFSFISFIHIVSTKVLIITNVFNRPDFIELQYKLYKKFLKDDYEIFIFDDSDNSEMQKQMENMCEKLNLNYKKIPRCIHKILRPSERAAAAIQYSLENLGFLFNGIVAIISSDVFLTKPFSISDYMSDNQIGGLYQNRKHIEYLWDGLIFFDMAKLPEKNKLNFSCGVIDDTIVDCGGFLYFYLKKYPNLKIHYFDDVYINGDINDKSSVLCNDCKSNKSFSCTHNTKKLEQKNFNEKQITFIQSGIDNVEFLVDNTFLHYRCGTNWNNKDIHYHFNKTILVNRYFNSIY